MAERTAWQEKVGVGEPARALLRHGKATRKRDVIIEEGPKRGQVGGFHTDHHDGRVDATVKQPATVRATASISQLKEGS
jgi:hypothetical protein